MNYCELVYTTTIFSMTDICHLNADSLDLTWRQTNF